MRSLALITTGGTIATERSGGAPALRGRAVLAGMNDGDETFHLSIHAPINLPSPHITLRHVALIARCVRDAVEAGAQGVVVTHGTDTLEETAFALALLDDGTVPLVVTGAMRPALAEGSDGPANLRAALLVASSPEVAGAGPVVVIDDEIHSSLLVHKVRSSGVGAFSSAPFGPLGFVSEGVARLVMKMRQAPPKLHFGQHPAPIPVLLAGGGLEAEVIEALAGKGMAGLVVAGAGGGHVSAEAAIALGRVAERIPVILATRPAGRTLTESYGYVGGDIDLIARGLVPAGSLGAAKARVALGLMLSDRWSIPQVRAGFEKIGRIWE